MFKARDSRTNSGRPQKSDQGQWIPDSKYAYIDRGVFETDDVNVGIKVETIAGCAWDSKELIDRIPGTDRQKEMTGNTAYF